jgi:hypothetical protein
MNVGVWLLCGLAKSACISAELQSWSHFQGALMLLQACGDLVTRAEKFAALINVTLTDAAEKVWLRQLLSSLLHSGWFSIRIVRGGVTPAKQCFCCTST